MPPVLEIRRTGGLVIPGESRLVMGALPGRSLLESLPPPGPARRALARAVGATCRAIDEARLGHPELHCGHVLVDESGNVGVVDAARVGAAPHLAPTLAALFASCPTGVTRTDRYRVLHAAAGGSTAAAKVLAHAATLAARAVAPKLRRRAVGSITPEIEMDGGRVRADEGALESILAHAFETAAAFREDARGQMVRDRDGCQNVRWHLRGSGPEARWYGKRYTRRPLGVRLRAFLELEPTGDPALREWTMLRRCRALGIPVAPPVALGLPGPRGEASFVVTAEVPAARPLDDLLREIPARARATRGALAAALADLVYRFHSVGLTHRDLYLNHVLVAETPAGPALTLIDLARAQHDAPWARHRLVKDLAALEYSAAPLPTRAERWRWLARYLRRRPTADDRALAREAVRKAARIGTHERRVAARAAFRPSGAA